MIISSTRLELHLFTEETKFLYFELMKDIRVMQYITGEALSEAKCEERFEKLLNINKTSPEAGVHAVFEKSIQKWIGFSKIVYEEEGRAEIGYALLPDFWGQGYASEITKSLIEYTPSIPKLHTLTAIINPANIGSKRVLTKQGFFLEKNYTLDGLPASKYILVIK